MHRGRFRLLLLVFIPSLRVFADPQQLFYSDTIHSGGKGVESVFNLDLPIGQLFVEAPDSFSGYSSLHCYSPSAAFIPCRSTKSLRNQKITDFSASGNVMRCSAGAAQGVSKPYSYRMANSSSLGDANNIVWEFLPDPSTPVRINLNSGFGSSRFDLSGLKITNLRVSSGASDVIIAWSRPNQSEMQILDIQGGMGKVIIRNLDMARARKVVIRNGVGETRLIYTNSCAGPSDVKVEVGAGKCIILVDPEVPMRLVVNASFLSSVSVPSSFLKSSENVYTNTRYKTSPDQGINLVVDVGMGDFALIPNDR